MGIRLVNRVPGGTKFGKPVTNTTSPTYSLHLELFNLQNATRCFRPDAESPMSTPLRSTLWKRSKYHSPSLTGKVHGTCMCYVCKAASCELIGINLFRNWSTGE